MARDVPFRFPVSVRYLEVDQQGVVFNMWYLAYFDDAMTAFLAAGGLDYGDMFAAGTDVQLVHTELDWSGSVRWGDAVVVEVRLVAMGTTSFRLGLDVRVGDTPGEPAVRAETVYVAIDVAGDGAKCPVPALLADALGPVTPC